MIRKFREAIRLILPMLAVLSMAVSTPAHAVTKRSADVVVVNETGKTILQLNVAHKYSDEYSHDLKWSGLLKSGQTTSAKTVEYNTGFGTTGKDWWYVSWVYTDASKINYSNPNNFRGVIDSMEKVAAVGIPLGGALASIVVGTVCTLGTAGGCGGATAAAAIPATTAAVAAISAAASGELLADGGTDGFKQHILRGDDAGKTVKIILKKDGDITITSPSGLSETKYSSKDTELTPSQLKAIEAKVDDFKKNKKPDLQKIWRSSYGNINFIKGTYGDNGSNKTISVRSHSWDEAKQAIVVSGLWGRSDAPNDPKKQGSFTFYFTDKCHFEGSWMYLIPEFDPKTLQLKTHEWTGSCS